MIQISSEHSLPSTQYEMAELRCHFPFGNLKNTPLEHWGRLRVANTVTLAPGQGFNLGDENAVEILTFVISGDIRATIGPRAVTDEHGHWLHAGDLHQISCGEGTDNLSWIAGAQGAVLFQAWLMPEVEGGILESAIRRHDSQGYEPALSILASGFPEDGPEDGIYRHDNIPVPVRTYARLLLGDVGDAEVCQYDTLPDRFLYIIILSGSIIVNGIIAIAGDRGVITDESLLAFSGAGKGRFLLIDVD